VEALRWALARLPLPSDGQAVHDARVATRRLGMAWGAFSSCLVVGPKRRRQLHRADRQLGGLRDVEVRLNLLDQVLGPVAVWRDRSDDPRSVAGRADEVALTQEDRVRPGLRGLEMEARRALADSTDSEAQRLRTQLLTEPVLGRLQALTRLPELRPGHPGTSAARELAERQLPRHFKRAALPRAGEAGLHQRRIELRKLRYRLELFVPVLGPGHQTVLQQLRQLHGLLGHFHDVEVLGGWIQGSAQQLPHELRPALRRLVVRVELEHQVSQEAAKTQLAHLDESGWWATARAACLG
jgi:CHAD domain-containing protein